MGCEYLLKNTPAEISVTNGNIGFVVFKNTGKIIDESPFFIYFLEGLNNKLSEYGYNLSFLYMNRRTPLEFKSLQLRNSDCKGFIIFGVEMKREDLQVFIDTGLPFVVLDNSFQDSDVDSVAINNSQGISKVVSYAYDMGHRKIGYIRCKDRINSFEERFRAYKRWLKYMGLKYNEAYVCDVGYSEVEVRSEIKDFLEKTEDLPTLFVAENDFIACSAIHGLEDAGYKVPDHISVIGFDDRPICQMIVPTVTTVNVPKEAFGASAVEILMNRMKNPREYSVKIEVGTKLIKRSSVRKL